MDNASKKVPMIINLMLVFMAIVDQLYLFFSSYYIVSTAINIASVLTIIALIAAFIYVVTEYSKASSKYFKLFIASYAVSSLAFLMDAGATGSLAGIFLTVLSLLFMAVLLVVKDLGKKKSILISFAILLSELSVIIAMSLSNISEIDLSVMILFALSRLTIPIVLVIMMFLKYDDKQMRGTK